MDISLYDALKALAEPVGTISGAAYALYHIAHRMRKDREHENAKVLQEAKESISAVKADLDSDIEALKTEVQTLKDSTASDLAHVKEIHSSEIKNLAEKIENLRTQLNEHHSQLVTFLTRLVEKQ